MQMKGKSLPSGTDCDTYCPVNPKRINSTLWWRKSLKSKNVECFLKRKNTHSFGKLRWGRLMKFSSVNGRLSGRLSHLSGFQIQAVICAGILLTDLQALLGWVWTFLLLQILLSNAWGNPTLGLHKASGSHLIQVPAKKAYCSCI